ncbi:MAG: hypothetical protein ACIAQF_07775 [Phycisphaerales bacterium JB065]
MHTGTKFRPQPEITRLKEAVGILNAEDPDMPIARLVVLMDIYHHEGTPFHEIVSRTGLPRSNVSRHVAKLDIYGYPKSPHGSGLVYSVEDMDNRRQRLIYLTEAGRRLAKRLTEAMR